MSDSDSNGPKSPVFQVKTIPTVPYAPDDMPVIFTDGALVSRSHHNWTIVFTQAEMPLLIGELPESIRSRGVVRIVMPADKMMGLIESLIRQGIEIAEDGSVRLDSDE